MENKKTIGVSNFVKRQTYNSEFTHYSTPYSELTQGSWKGLKKLVSDNLDQAKPGYRDGVILVPVPPERFWCGVVLLSPGDALVGSYEPRYPGEESRKKVRAVRPWGKSQCEAVDIVLYSKELLISNDEESTGADWDIISINGRPTVEEMPMHPNTLMANHFNESGGTPTNMNSEEFEKALEISFKYWKNKELISPWNKNG